MVDPRNPQGYRNQALVTALITADPCAQCGSDPCECSQAFSAEFGPAMQPGCDVPCIDHCVGDLLVHGSAAPYECLPWQADTSCDDGWDEYEPKAQRRALALAWRTMKTLTAGRIAAGCSIVRPC